MSKQKIDKILFLASIILGVFVLYSCVMDRITAFCIRNCTNDTLYIELSESDTLDNWIYWSKYPKDTKRPIMPKDTTWIYIHRGKVVIDNFFYAPPDSMVFASPYSFKNNDTCYIYAIKHWVVTHYSLEEIRTKKLYDRKTVIKKDFCNSLYEYRDVDSAEDHSLVSTKID